MFNIFIKLLVSKLHNLFLLVALTGFVCTYKIQAEEECLSSNILCYECDSRYDPNCADPFDLSSLSLADQQSLAARTNKSTIHNDNNNHNNNNNNNHNANGGNSNNQQRQQTTDNRFDGTDSGWVGNFNMTMFRPKKMPNVVVCHGCCVKITSKTTDGATYVKRTCTTNLQINYFMVGLVCMKESGDRGKMCFCETDYCNGQPSNRQTAFSIIASLLTIIALLVTTKLSTTLIGQTSIHEHITSTSTRTSNKNNCNNNDNQCTNGGVAAIDM